MPKVPKNSQEAPRVYQKLLKVAKSWQEMSKIANKMLKFPNVAKSCQIHQKLPKLNFRLESWILETNFDHKVMVVEDFWALSSSNIKIITIIIIIFIVIFN